MGFAQIGPEEKEKEKEKKTLIVEFFSFKCRLGELRFFEIEHCCV